MKIELKHIPIRDIFAGYLDSGEGGVVGYDGKLNIRPPYQREFVYKDRQRDAVISTIRKGFPLNIMYWAVNEDDSFEVLDGQQRTISFCQYIKGDFSIDYRFFHNLTEDEQAAILDYEVTVYWCEGNTREKLDWFEVVNIAGEKLTAQELRNAVYTGPWLADAKLKFSRTNCPASLMSRDYVLGKPIRQELLEKALKWRSKDKGKGDEIREYMAKHQHDQNANDLWLYFKNLIDWIEATFRERRVREMRNVEWGPLYDEFGSIAFDTDALEAEIAKLMQDDDVTNQSGVYAYVLTRNERHLSIRQFSDKERRAAYERQGGICAKCKEHFTIEEMEADHITPWSQGGRTTADNCQMLCKPHNRLKSDV